MVFEGACRLKKWPFAARIPWRFGPLKPVGLPDPRTGEDPYAVVQLRQDNGAGSLFNMVGFQTHLRWPEQKRVFRMIPGLEEAEFIRYGVMHKNSYLNSPSSSRCRLQPAESSSPLFCRSDDRCGRVCGIGSLRPCCRHLPFPYPFWKGKASFPQGNGHWCPVSLHQQSRSQAFPAHEY